MPSIKPTDPGRGQSGNELESSNARLRCLAEGVTNGYPSTLMNTGARLPLSHSKKEPPIVSDFNRYRCGVCEYVPITISGAGVPVHPA